MAQRRETSSLGSVRLDEWQEGKGGIAARRVAYLCDGPADTDDEQLIRVAGRRWAIEECFQSVKGQVGLDEYQVRRYIPWYRHITLAMVAHAFLTVTAATAAQRHANGMDWSPLPLPRLDACWHT